MVSIETGVLDHVRRVDLAPKTTVNLDPGQELQVAPVERQESAQRLVAWLAVMAILEMTEVVAPNLVQNIGQLLRGELVVLTGHTIGVLAGFGMLKRRKWALATGLGLSLLQCAAAVAILTGLASPFGGVYQDPFLRTTVFSILVPLFLIQTVACFAAVLATRAARPVVNSIPLLVHHSPQCIQTCWIKRL